MKCPKCETKLNPQQVGDVELDVCANCGGIWLDLGELKALLRQSEQFQAAATPPAGAQTGIYDTLTGPCPRCAGQGHMTRLQDLDRPDITMDSCPVCYGIWLDGGEFNQLARKDIIAGVRRFLRRNFGV
ncbi:MAG: zf-TFIIB domain-containing protein [Anaerolineales bacterium]|nr:zf-TFIIB domain-containing protein [Anaerolineales bacterium]MCB0009366.1 zf-TFIIB domain-containing protein [Anaerolineales bacterium]MCB0014191.1 zf-TFIIB domain-containing protein [Anaerolineales bacterium]MCB8959020.1 zf-TFIIB domain-containing protein [Ardenticatenales bacterium]MCB8963398.1 zf-TFIIB domain-containing protein [Ardenticatenales bacterium]